MRGRREGRRAAGRGVWVARQGAAEPADLVAVIRRVAHGDALLSPAATRSLVARFLAHPDHRSPPDRSKLVLLTEREREVVILIAAGLAFPPGPAAS